MARIRRRVRVSGRVQGVGFRASTADQARLAGVDGWVRNLADGRVEAVFDGERERVERMVAWCRGGPRFARVDAIEIDETPPEALEGFRIR